MADRVIQGAHRSLLGRPRPLWRACNHLALQQASETGIDRARHSTGAQSIDPEGSVFDCLNIYRKHNVMDRMSEGPRRQQSRVGLRPGHTTSHRSCHGDAVRNEAAGGLS